MALRPRKPLNEPGANDTVDVDANVRDALVRATSSEGVPKQPAPANPVKPEDKPEPKQPKA